MSHEMHHLCSGGPLGPCHHDWCRRRRCCRSASRARSCVDISAPQFFWPHLECPQHPVFAVFFQFFWQFQTFSCDNQHTDAQMGWVVLRFPAAPCSWMWVAVKSWKRWFFRHESIVNRNHYTCCKLLQQHSNNLKSTCTLNGNWWSFAFDFSGYSLLQTVTSRTHGHVKQPQTMELYGIVRIWISVCLRMRTPLNTPTFFERFEQETDSERLPLVFKPSELQKSKKIRKTDHCDKRFCRTGYWLSIRLIRWPNNSARTRSLPSRSCFRQTGPGSPQRSFLRFRINRPMAWRLGEIGHEKVAQNKIPWPTTVAKICHPKLFQARPHDFIVPNGSDISCCVYMLSITVFCILYTNYVPKNRTKSPLSFCMANSCPPKVREQLPGGSKLRVLRAFLTERQRKVDFKNRPKTGGTFST